MKCKRVFAAGAVALLCSTAVFADDPLSMSSAEKKGGVVAAVKTAVFLPFKGIVCLAGVISAPAAYVGSGLDPQVRDDAAKIRSHYCSAQYLFSSEWTE